MYVNSRAQAFLLSLVLVSLTSMQVAQTSAQRPMPKASTPNTPNSQRVIERFDFSRIDDLLRLPQLNVRMVIFRDRSEAEVSSVHLAVFKKWIKDGGIGFFTQQGLNGSLFQKLQVVNIRSLQVKKENGVWFNSNSGDSNDCIGELFVRDALDTIVIAQHSITRSVSSLYVCGIPPLNWAVLDPLPAVNLIPILQVQGEENGAIRINSPQAKKVTIFGVLESGRGLVVVDGTGLSGGYNKFKGNGYDWPVMYQNILKYSPEKATNYPTETQLERSSATEKKNDAIPAATTDSQHRTFDPSNMERSAEIAEKEKARHEKAELERARLLRGMGFSGEYFGQFNDKNIKGEVLITSDGLTFRSQEKILTWRRSDVRAITNCHPQRVRGAGLFTKVVVCKSGGSCLHTVSGETHGFCTPGYDLQSLSKDYWREIQE